MNKVTLTKTQPTNRGGSRRGTSAAAWCVKGTDIKVVKRGAYWDAVSGDHNNVNGLFATSKKALVAKIELNLSGECTYTRANHQPAPTDSQRAADVLAVCSFFEDMAKDKKEQAVLETATKLVFNKI